MTYKLNVIKIKNLCLSREVIKRVKKQAKIRRYLQCIYPTKDFPTNGRQKETIQLQMARDLEKHVLKRMVTLQ